MIKIKRAAAIHDLSCVGRCALAVVLPVLSAMGHQAVPLPTALVSAHTGGFGGIYYSDLHSSMREIAAHWKKSNIDFDAVYSGFLGSEAQIETVAGFIADFRKPGGIVLVDPVMGDDGILYSSYNQKMITGMCGLCGSADIITPNLTEACFLADVDYTETNTLTEPALDKFIRGLFARLKQLGAPAAVITGVASGGGRNIATVCADYASGDYYKCVCPRVAQNYPGTGDVFASVLLGGLLRGTSLFDSVKFASEFVYETVRHTYENFPDTPVREGVAIERCLDKLYIR